MNRKENLVKKFGEDVYKKASELKDPSSTNKYISWICSQLKRGYNEPDIEGTIDWHFRNAKRLKNPDIFAYKDLKVLEDEIKDLGESGRKQTEEKKSSEIVFENDKFKVIYPLSRESMQCYGMRTRWCIASSDPNSTYYNHYVSKGAHFYVIIDKKNAENKNCLVIHKEHIDNTTIPLIYSVTIFDSRDREHPFASYKSNDVKIDGQIWEAVYSHAVSSKGTYLHQLFLLGASDNKKLVDLIKTEGKSNEELLKEIIRENALEDNDPAFNVIYFSINMLDYHTTSHICNNVKVPIDMIPAILVKIKKAYPRYQANALIDILHKNCKVFDDKYLRSKSYAVRASLAENTTNIDVLKILLKDRSKTVVVQAAKRARIKDIVELINSDRKRMKSTLKECLEERLYDDKMFVRWAVKQLGMDKLASYPGVSATKTRRNAV